MHIPQHHKTNYDMHQAKKSYGAKGFRILLPPLKAQKVAGIKLVQQLINFMVWQVTQALISKKCAVNWDFDCILAILRP